MRRPLIIAVDGPAASGKGTIANGLAVNYGLPCLDTGLLYRAVGVRAMKAAGGVDQTSAVAAAQALDPGHLDDPALRTRAAGELASQAAVFAGVRAALLDFQRQFAGQPGGAVLDGRDIGTVICPHAPAKIFVTAAAEVRAERRFRQLTAQGEGVTYADILADIRKRDERDSHRSAAPLIRAADAQLLDTSEMTISQAADAARRIVEAARTKLA
jgi:cytidylate kinase